jgi:hypothetical protein
LPPNVFVIRICDPASRYPRWILRTTSGFERFHTSGGSPNIRPLANSIVPIAPSAMTVRFPAISSRQRSLAAPPSARRRSSRAGKAEGSNGSGSTVGL